MKKGEIKENVRFCYIPSRLTNDKLVWLIYVHEKWVLNSYWEDEVSALGRKTKYRIEKLRWGLYSRTTF